MFEKVKVLEMIEQAKKYKELFADFESVRVHKNYNTGGLYYDKNLEDELLPFVNYLCDKSRDLYSSGKIGEAERTMGFVQGILWSAGIFDLEDIINHIKNPETIPDTYDNNDRFD